MRKKYATPASCESCKLLQEQRHRADCAEAGEVATLGRMITRYSTIISGLMAENEALYHLLSKEQGKQSDNNSGDCERGIGNIRYYPG